MTIKQNHLKNSETKIPSEFWVQPDAKGSLGLLALGARGVKMWREARTQLQNTTHENQK
ncbi:MAG: hypothetical protein LAT76_07140 [Schleiferiaceae bacterium]|nr:hypothetical protein [Schleiferiaceae bacterium]